MGSRTKKSRSVTAGDRRRAAGPWHVPAFERRFFNGRRHQAPTAGPLTGLVFPMLESLVFLLALIVLSMPVQAQTPSGTPAPAPTPTVIHPQPIQIQPAAPPQTVIPSQPIQIEKGPTVTITGVQPVNPPLGLPGLPPTQPLTLEHPWGTLQAQHGQLACSDPALNNACGYETADKLGTYKLNMSCSDGFYDPIWGGSCWKCPAGDGWIRSANNIQNDDACWRVPKETTAGAQRVKNTPWAWDCSSGSFWDGYDGGACWKCPDAQPRRTAYAVWDSRACASPVNETGPATLVKFNGCPSIQQAIDDKTLTLSGKRIPGRPFLDIGAGWTQGQASGVCYACPEVDAAGNFLVTDRTAASVTSAHACAIRFKWTPPPFVEPGLAELGAAAIVAEQRILDPAGFTNALYLLAAANKIPAGTTTAWVAAQWAAIAANPYQNHAFQTAVYMRLVAAANTAPAARTPAQAQIVADMEKYIQSKRTFIAQTALDMYDAWKVTDDQERQSHKQSQVGQLFYYGTVPLDFNGMAAAILTPVGSLGAAGDGLVGALVAASKFGEAANFVVKADVPANANAIFIQLRAGKLLANAAEGLAEATSIVSGATVIEIAGAVLSSIAIDQFIAIIDARPRLEAALATAQQPISLQTLVSSGDGQDLLKWYYTMAVGDPASQLEDPQVVALAKAANAAAAQTAYAKPQ